MRVHMYQQDLQMPDCFRGEFPMETDETHAAQAAR